MARYMILDKGLGIESYETSSNKNLWLPSILLALIYFNMWAPPGLWISGIRWFMLGGISFFIFILQGFPIDIEFTKLYWQIYGAYFLGAVLSLFRATHVWESLYLTVGMGINFWAYLLFVPTLALRRTRKLMLFSLLGASTLWAIEIQKRVYSLYSYNPYILFSGGGNDKNYISLSLMMSALALLVFVLFRETEGKQENNFLTRIFTIISMLLCVFFAYSLLLTYSRSAFAALILGAVIILIVKASRQDSSVGKLLLFIGVLIVVSYVLANQVLEVLPRWQIAYDDLESSSRVVLVEKALTVISQNPLVGIGQGGIRYGFTDSMGREFPRKLVHNSYLAAWAEYGILGMIGYFCAVAYYVRSLIFRFDTFDLVDKIWLLIFPGYFAMLFFLDLGSNSQMMFALLAGMYYEQQMVRLGYKNE